MTRPPVTALQKTGAYADDKATGKIIKGEIGDAGSPSDALFRRQFGRWIPPCWAGSPRIPPGSPCGSPAGCPAWVPGIWAVHAGATLPRFPLFACTRPRGAFVIFPSADGKERSQREITPVLFEESYFCDLPKRGWEREITERSQQF